MAGSNHVSRRAQLIPSPLLLSIRSSSHEGDIVPSEVDVHLRVAPDKSNSRGFDGKSRQITLPSYARPSPAGTPDRASKQACYKTLGAHRRVHAFLPVGPPAAAPRLRGSAALGT